MRLRRSVFLIHESALSMSKYGNTGHRKYTCDLGTPVTDIENQELLQNAHK